MFTLMVFVITVQVHHAAAAVVFVVLLFFKVVLIHFSNIREMHQRVKSVAIDLLIVVVINSFVIIIVQVGVLQMNKMQNTGNFKHFPVGWPIRKKCRFHWFFWNRVEFKVNLFVDQSGIEFSSDFSEVMGFIQSEKLCTVRFEKHRNSPCKLTALSLKHKCSTLCVSHKMYFGYC